MIDYYLEVTLQDERTLQTEVESYEFGEIHVDLSVLEQTIAWASSNVDGASPFVLSAKIVNLGSATVRNVPVQFLQTLVTEETVLLEEELQNATPIGAVQVLAEVPPGGEVLASVPWQPTPGNYLVTVVVDMPSAEQPRGVIIERRERNNTATRRFASNWILLTPAQQEIVSGDGMLRLSFAPGSIQTPTLMTFERKELTVTNQPDIVPTSASPVAYQLGLDAQNRFAATVSFLLEETSTRTTDSAEKVVIDNVDDGSTEKNVITQTTVIERLANNKKHLHAGRENRKLDSHRR